MIRDNTNDNIAITLLNIGSILIGPLAKGWVLSLLWGWFFVPTFGLPAIGIAAAIGIVLTVRYVVISVDFDKKDTRSPMDKAVSCFIASVFAPIMVLAFGYIIKQLL